MDIVKKIAQQVMQPDFEPSQLGRVRGAVNGDLVILGYTEQAQYGKDWKPEELACRGLIINKVTGEIVARPFSKFFNMLEAYPADSAKLVSVTEKVDGSLAILYRDNGFKIATRGAFHSMQADWATEHFNRLYSNLEIPDEWTMLFEAVFKENKIVIDYGNREDLFLLAIINRFTGYEYPSDFVDKYAQDNGLVRPARFDVYDTESLLVAAKQLDVNHEGWVLRYSDGSRFKIKGDAYREMHRIISMISFKNIVGAIGDGTIDKVLELVPDEFYEQIKQWRYDVEMKVAEIQTMIFNDLTGLTGSRKESAIWIMENRKEYSSLYFAALDNKDTRPMILKRFTETGAATY